MIITKLKNFQIIFENFKNHDFVSCRYNKPNEYSIFTTIQEGSCSNFISDHSYKNIKSLFVGLLYNPYFRCYIIDEFLSEMENEHKDTLQRICDVSIDNIAKIDGCSILNEEHILDMDKGYTSIMNRKTPSDAFIETNLEIKRKRRGIDGTLIIKSIFHLNKKVIKKEIKITAKCNNELSEKLLKNIVLALNAYAKKEFKKLKTLRIKYEGKIKQILSSYIDNAFKDCITIEDLIVYIFNNRKIMPGEDFYIKITENSSVTYEFKLYGRSGNE